MSIIHLNRLSSSLDLMVYTLFYPYGESWININLELVNMNRLCCNTKFPRILAKNTIHFWMKEGDFNNWLLNLTFELRLIIEIMSDFKMLNRTSWLLSQCRKWCTDTYRVDNYFTIISKHSGKYGGKLLWCHVNG